MNVLILNGGPAGERGATCRRIKAAAAREAAGRGWTVEALDLDGLSIKPCRGCFACWLKHPGTCAIHDDEEHYLKAWVGSDAVFLTTPVTFGGYSSALKKAFDRSIPIALPFFIKSHGEVHHPLRYERRKRILAAGTLPGPDGEAEAIFHGLVRRNAINLASLRSETCILYDSASDAELAVSIADLIRTMEAA
jgi:multimeric flavodoxin WrbA